MDALYVAKSRVDIVVECCHCWSGEFSDAEEPAEGMQPSAFSDPVASAGCTCVGLRRGAGECLELQAPTNSVGGDGTMRWPV